MIEFTEQETNIIIRSIYFYSTFNVASNNVDDFHKAIEISEALWADVTKFENVFPVRGNPELEAMKDNYRYLVGRGWPDR